MSHIRTWFSRHRLVAKGGEGTQAFLINDDIRPLALKDRTWNAVTYVVFWFSATTTVAQWYAASVGQALGLSLWESLICSLAGHFLMGVVMVFNGRAGATYHIGFPVLCRTAFGVYGAWWPIVNRVFMAIVWNGVNAVQGGQCVYVMLHALFPGIARIPDAMGPRSAVTSGGMIGVILFWATTCIFLIFPIPKMRSLVYAKLVVFLISAVVLAAWVTTKAGGLGPVIRQPGSVHGAERSWLIFRFVMLGAANSAPFGANAADFQRYATKNTDVIAGNLIGFPVAIFVVSLFGNLVCAAGQLIFGHVIWNPVTLLDNLQTMEYTPANRAACFFIALCFAYSAIFSSIFENSVPAGNDLAALVPKYITIRRGFFLCAVISLTINPWYLLGSASVFVSFISSYQVFMCTITGILIVQYYAICRGHIVIPDCFTADKAGVYHYTKGFNFRAFAAYVIGTIPNFYGFLNNMGVHAPIGVTRFYYVAYWVGLFLSGASYWLFCKIWRPAQMETGWLEPRDYVRPEEEGVVAETSAADVGKECDIEKHTVVKTQDVE